MKSPLTICIMLAFITIAHPQTSFEQQLSDARKMSSSGEYTKADSLLNRLLKSGLNKDQELQVYKFLYSNSNIEANKYRLLEAARIIALRSREYKGERFSQLKGLLAEQAYNFHRSANGYAYNSDLYNAMYFALKEFNDPLTRTYGTIYENPGDIFLINSIKDRYFFSIHQNGSLLKWNIDGDMLSFEKHSSFWNRVTVKTVEVSEDGLSLFMAGTLNNSAFAEIFDTRDLSRKASLKQLGSSVIDAAYLKNDAVYLLDNYGKMISLYSNNYTNTLFEPEEKLTQITVNRLGTTLYGTGSEGNLYAYDILENHRASVVLSTNHRLRSIEINHNDSLVAVGDYEGNIYLSIDNKWQVLAGHTAAIVSMAFSSDGKHFASASADKSIRVYNLEELNRDPLVLRDHNSAVTSLAFSKDSQRLLAGTHNRAIKSWPMDIESMSGRMCNYLLRNMTKEEWKRNIGSEIAYQNTCNNINTNETP